jgi:hypothetical protein
MAVECSSKNSFVLTEPGFMLSTSNAGFAFLRPDGVLQLNWGSTGVFHHAAAFLPGQFADHFFSNRWSGSNPA